MKFSRVSGELGGGQDHKTKADKKKREKKHAEKFT